jgi:DNA glycosylase AlkZ-like
MLLRRRSLAVADALEHLVGLQAQSPNAPYVGLWSRLADFTPQSLAGLITARKAVRTLLMRTTLHLVTARDCLALRPALQQVLERGFFTGSPFGRRIQGVNIGKVVAAGRKLLEEKPHTVVSLGKLLGPSWPGQDPASLAQAVRYLVPLVQVPPRGVWGRGGQAAWTTVESWLGKPVAAAPAPARLVLRYLAAFGPATIRDIQAWSWVTGLSDVVEGLRPKLRSFHDDEGRELFDLPDGPRPSPDTPAPVRFLPEYDNLLVSHDDRTRVIANGYLQRVFTRGSFLVNGFVRGAWKISRSRDGASLSIEPFEAMSKADRLELAEEGNRLLAFAAAGTTVRDIRFISRTREKRAG